MYNQALSTTIPVHQLHQFAYAPIIYRYHGWLGRKCPSCHQIGWVGIYEGRLAESERYINKATWECVTCQKISAEVF